MVQFKVDHEHFSSTMCMMNKFREDSSLCDIKLIIGNQTLQAHRCVLAAGSPYFNTLFLGQFTEASMKEINLSEVTNNISALKKVVAFIYTGEINIDEENLSIIIKLSSFFLIESLRNFCCTFMIDNFSLATCLKYYLYSIDHDLLIVEKNVEPMVQSRFHDYLIYEENSMDISTEEMKLLVERNILQHCSNVSIVRFIALWVNKWLTERHVLIAKSIFDDLLLRENSPKVCPKQLTNEPSDASLYKMIDSSLSVKCKSRDIFLNSLKQVLLTISSENDMHIGKTSSDHNYSDKETAIITVSPSYENLEFHIL